MAGTQAVRGASTFRLRRVDVVKEVPHFAYLRAILVRLQRRDTGTGWGLCWRGSATPFLSDAYWVTTDGFLAVFFWSRLQVEVGVRTTV